MVGLFFRMEDASFFHRFHLLTPPCIMLSIFIIAFIIGVIVCVGRYDAVHFYTDTAFVYTLPLKSCFRPSYKSPSFEEWMEGVWEEKGGGEGVWVGRKDGVALFTRHRQ